jgi:hypothetical protein
MDGWVPDGPARELPRDEGPRRSLLDFGALYGYSRHCCPSAGGLQSAVKDIRIVTCLARLNIPATPICLRHLHLDTKLSLASFERRCLYSRRSLRLSSFSTRVEIRSSRDTAQKCGQNIRPFPMKEKTPALCRRDRESRIQVFRMSIPPIFHAVLARHPFLSRNSLASLILLAR